MLPLLYACDSVLMVEDGAAIVYSDRREDHGHFIEVQMQFPTCSPLETYAVGLVANVVNNTVYLNTGIKIKVDGDLAGEVKERDILLMRHKRSNVYTVLALVHDDEKYKVYISELPRSRAAYHMVERLAERLQEDSNS